MGPQNLGRKREFSQRKIKRNRRGTGRGTRGSRGAEGKNFVRPYESCSIENFSVNLETIF